MEASNSCYVQKQKKKKWFSLIQFFLIPSQIFIPAGFFWRKQRRRNWVLHSRPADVVSKKQKAVNLGKIQNLGIHGDAGYHPPERRENASIDAGGHLFLPCPKIGMIEEAMARTYQSCNLWINQIEISDSWNDAQERDMKKKKR